MQVFVTDKYPRQSAKNLDDGRISKMIVESAQLLSMAVYITRPHLYILHMSELYRPYNLNHPIIKDWLIKSTDKQMWLLDHLKYLLEEYQTRFDNKREHKTTDCYHALTVIYSGEKLKYDIDNLKFFNFAKRDSMGIDYTDIKCPIKAYQLYLNHRWEISERPVYINKVRIN